MFNLYVNVNVDGSSESISDGGSVGEIARGLMQQGGIDESAQVELEIVLMSGGDIFYQDGQPVVMRIKV